MQDFLEFIRSNIQGIWVAGIGGLAHYVYKLSKGEEFSFTKLVLNIILAGWIGYLCQEMGLSSVYTSVAGFCSYPLLNLIETKGPEIIFSILKK